MLIRTSVTETIYLHLLLLFFMKVKHCWAASLLFDVKKAVEILPPSCEVQHYDTEKNADYVYAIRRWCHIKAITESEL